MIPFISSNLPKMVSNSSEFRHYSLPLLRAFNLSNQLFSLHHERKATIQAGYANAALFLHEPSVEDRIPPAVRASFLLQMWGELEVETMLCSTPHNSLDEFTELESLTKEVAGSASADTPSPSPLQETSEKELNVSQDFSLKLDEEGEVTALSRYPCHGCVQTLIRLRSIRQAATIIHEEWSQRDTAVRFDAGSSNSFMREGPEEKNQHDINEVPIEESKSVLEVRLSSSHFYVLLHH